MWTVTLKRFVTAGAPFLPIHAVLYDLLGNLKFEIPLFKITCEEEKKRVTALKTQIGKILQLVTLH